MKWSIHVVLGAACLAAGALPAAAQVFIAQIPSGTVAQYDAGDPVTIVNEPDDGSAILALSPPPHQLPAGIFNESTVEQVGFNNNASVTVDGTGNLTEHRQFGTGHEATAIIVGADNRVSVTQDGQGHVSLVELLGTNGVAVTHVQNNQTVSQTATTKVYGIPSGPITINSAQAGFIVVSP